jgi:AmmeMemoRadiSam system protein A
MEIDKIKEKILNYSKELKQLALEVVYFKLNNLNLLNESQKRYNFLFTEFKDIKLGCFVSFYIENNLRGCVGTIEPVFNNVILEIINNSISSAFKDPRFEPISLKEYPHLQVKIDFIINIEKISSLTSLDPKKYGVIVKKENKRGVLLPDIPNIDTIQKQLEIAFNKAGLKYNKENLLKENEIYRFEVIRI